MPGKRRVNAASRGIWGRRFRPLKTPTYGQPPAGQRRAGIRAERQGPRRARGQSRSRGPGDTGLPDRLPDACGPWFAVAG
jgi:hypothetical protein